MIRDKSVLFTNIFMPLFGLPLYIILAFEFAGIIHNNQVKSLKDNTIFTVGIHGNAPKDLLNVLSKDAKIKIATQKSDIKESTIEAYRNAHEKYLELYKKRKGLPEKMKSVDNNSTDQNELQLQKLEDEIKKYKDQIQSSINFDRDNLQLVFFQAKNESTSIYYFYSAEVTISQNAKTYTKNIISKFAEDEVQRYIESRGIKQSKLNPFGHKEVNLNNINSVFYSSFGLIIGGGVLFMCLIGVLYPTVATTLGERDDKTFKVLLMNPLSLSEIFLGKYLNIALYGLITLTPYFMEFFIFYTWGENFRFLAKLPIFMPHNLILFVIATIVQAIFISSLSFLACSFAKSKTHAQSILTLLIFCLIVPIGTLAFSEIQLSPLSALIPIMNYPLMIKAMIQSTVTPWTYLLTVLSSFFISIGIILFSINAFKVQWMGKSDTHSLSDLFSRKHRKSKTIEPAHALLAFCIAYIGYVYGNILLISLQIKFLYFLLSPILFGLGTSALIMANSGIEFSKAFKWDNPFSSSIVPVLFSSFFLALFFNTLSLVILPHSDVQVGIFDILDKNNPTGILGLILIIGILPSIAEEILFRGIIFNGLRKQYSFLISSVVSSMFFSIVHFSIYQSFHTFFIGLILSFLYEKRGIYHCMAYHFIFNMVALAFSLNEEIPKVISQQSPLIQVFAMISFLILSLVFIWKKVQIKFPPQDDIKDKAA